MRNLTLLTILLLGFSTNSFAQKKWSFGLGAQTFRNKVRNIGQELKTAPPDMFGISQKYFTPKVQSGSILSYGAHFIADRKIGKRMSVDFGLGIQKIKDDLLLNYTADSTSQILRSNDNMLNIERTYLNIPANFNFFARLGSNVRLKTSLGITANYLLNVEDNYQDILTYDILIFPSSQYSKITLVGRAKVGIRYESDNQPVFEFNIFYNYGKYGTRTNSGFIYKNLSVANQLQKGLEVNYFFLH